MEYRIHGDGSFDLIGQGLSLRGCYPAVEGRALRVTAVETGADSVLYRLQGGSLRLTLRQAADGRLALDCAAEGLAGVHDIAPLAGAQADGAERIYVQGLGMEGPSGNYEITGAAPESHGLTALWREGCALTVCAEDHRDFGLCLKNSAESGFSARFELECTGGDALTLPTLYLEESGTLSDGLGRAARRIAEAMHARRVKPPAFFWSSWYYAYETMDQKTLEEILPGLRASGLPFQYVELDAGYTPSLGDWLTPNHRWPGGLKKAAQTILEAGFQPGIWVGPFIVGDRSALYREHPDWVLREKDGSPHVQLRSYTEPKIWGNPDCDYYVLDTSHPEALAYITEVFRTLRAWGFAFFKTDFMLWNMHDSAKVLRHDPTLTSVQIMRRTLAAIRGAIGEETYLLGCIAPFMPFVGYADGMRLAGDCGARWAEPYGPVNMLRELPCDSYFNNILWQNDPDAMLLRDFATMLSPNEVRSLALLQALSGGIVSTSDPVHKLGEDRLALLRLVVPHGAHTPTLPQLGKGRRELIMTHTLPQGKLLFVMNPTDEPLTIACRLRALFGDKNWYQYRYNWEETDAKSVREDVFIDTLAPHDSALLFVTEEPLRKKPVNLWSW